MWPLYGRFVYFYWAGSQWLVVLSSVRHEWHCGGSIVCSPLSSPDNFGINFTILRDEASLATYRYEWAGNFSNIAPVQWLGAYHYSDLYMFFGTYLIAPGEIPELEVQVSEAMQDLLFEFVKDPASLPSKGWPEYGTGAEGGGQLARFGAGGQAFQVVNGDAVDVACHIEGAIYHTSP